MDRTDRRPAREANKAHKQEQKHERKEARLHGKAMNAALHGNLGRAAVLEARANQQHHMAQHANMREQTAGAALASRMAHNPGHPHHHHHHGPPPTVCPTAPPAGYSSVTVTRTTYTVPNQPGAIHYPTGQAPPPGAPPPYNPYYPPYPR